jgi:hypothetical protein
MAAECCARRSPSSSDDGFVEAPRARRLKGARFRVELPLSPSSSDDGFVEARQGRAPRHEAGHSPSSSDDGFVEADDAVHIVLSAGVWQQLTDAERRLLPRRLMGSAGPCWPS